MKTLEKGQDKIEKICEVLRKETLEPAEKQAAQIIEEGRRQAEEMIRQAEKKAELLIQKAQEEIEQEKRVFQSSLSQAAKQGLEYLRQEIEHKLFNPLLEALIISNTTQPQIIASMIEAIVNAVRKQGLSGDLMAYVPETVSAQAVTSLLMDEIIKQLKQGGVTVGSFRGGAQVKLIDKKMRIDMSDEALKELLAAYVRKDFRKTIFG